MAKRGMAVLGVCFAVAFVAAPVFAAPVPDAGVTKCYDDSGNVITCPSSGQRFYGQDGNYTINPPFCTKLNSNGNALPVTATSWAMVPNNLTDFIWMVKEAQE